MRGTVKKRRRIYLETLRDAMSNAWWAGCQYATRMK